MSTNTPETTPGRNWAVWIGLAVAAVIVVGLLVYAGGGGSGGGGGLLIHRRAGNDRDPARVSLA